MKYVEIINNYPIELEFSEKNRLKSIKLLSQANTLATTEAKDGKTKIIFSKIIKAITQQINGPWETITLEDWQDILDLDAFSEFQRQVYDQLCAIPRGTVISYNDLAKKAGNDKAARAVGSMMRKNPFHILIPCHRVVRHNGEIGHYAAGANIKKELLLKEKTKP